MSPVRRCSAARVPRRAGISRAAAESVRAAFRAGARHRARVEPSAGLGPRLDRAHGPRAQASWAPVARQRAASYGLRATGDGLRATGYGLRAAGQQRAAGCRLRSARAASYGLPGRRAACLAAGPPAWLPCWLPACPAGWLPGLRAAVLPCCRVGCLPARLAGLLAAVQHGWLPCCLVGFPEKAWRALGGARTV